MQRPGKRGWIGIGLAAAAVVVVIVVLVVSCGGSSSSSTTTTASMEGWANGLCSAANTYVASLKSMGSSLKGGNLSKDSINSLVDEAKTATQTFADSVKDLGEPPVSDSQGKQILETLQSQLSDDAEQVKSATSNVDNASEILNAVSVLTSTLKTAGTQISAAYSQIKQLDPKSDVQQSFQNAPACKSLTGS